MFFEEIKIGINDLSRLLAPGAGSVLAYIDLYVSRKFYVGDTGVNRKTLNDWEASGLLPFAYQEEGWRKFSFLEWAWLECIIEFRQLGVSFEKIKEIKNACFTVDADEIISFLKKGVQESKDLIDQKEEILAGYEYATVHPDIKLQFVQRFQMSPFLFTLLYLVLKDPNLCIVYNNNEFCSFFVLGEGGKDFQKVNQRVIQNLVNDSFVTLNLRKIVDKIFQKPGLRHNDDFILEFLSPGEKIIIDEIRNSNAKEITISFDEENVPTYIKVKRNRITEETLNKVARYLKKGNYQNIEFTTRDGQLIQYSEKDIIKLDKKRY
jgi:DNA-binding transcriptional MerR regulator